MTGLKYVSLLEASGYGNAAKAYLRGLIRAGVPLTWQPMVAGRRGYEPPSSGSSGDPLLDGVLRREVAYDTVLVHTTPEYYPFWCRREPGKRLVGYTAWETTALPSHWPRLLNTMDLLLVPSRWNAQVFRRAGVRTPVQVVPHIVESPPTADVAPLAGVAPETFVFYTIGPWTLRKAPWRTLEAYWRAFSREDSVLLIIKADGPDWRYYASGPLWRHVGRRVFTSRRALRRLERRRAAPAAVRLIAETVPEAVMQSLHARGDCYVSLCGAEGWGLGASDAAGRGKPVVMTGFGGQLDFLPAGDAFLVDYRLEEVARAGARQASGSWAVPDVDHAAALMRAVFEDRTAARERGRRLGEYVREHFAESVVIPRLLAALEMSAPGVVLAPC